MTTNNPSLYDRAAELRRIEDHLNQIASRLEDPDDNAAVAEIEALLQEQETSRESLIVKADAYCAIISKMRARQEFIADEIRRMIALGETVECRADRLEYRLVTALEAVDPDATRWELLRYELRSRRADRVHVIDEAAVPDEYWTASTRRQVDRRGIQQSLRAGLAIPGVRLETRRSWRIA